MTSSMNKKTLISFVLVIVLLYLVTFQASGFTNYIDNNVDSDSDVDSSPNLGNSGVTDYTDAQSLGGGSQAIQESNLDIYSENWPYYKQIFVDSSMVPGDLSGFPVLVKLYDNELKNKAQVDGDDIAFFDEHGNQLNHEIESYDPNYNSSHAELIAWVKSDLSSTKDTLILMKYGNSTMGSQQNPSVVWNSTYSNVWHLAEDPAGTAPQTQDSSGSADGTSYGAMTSDDLQSSWIGKGIDFDGTDDLISVGNLNSDAWTAITMSAWVLPTTIVEGRIFSVSRNSTTVSESDYAIMINSQGKIRTRISTDGDGGSAATSIDANSGYFPGSWFHMIATWDASTERIKLYINGTLERNVLKDGDSIRDSVHPGIIGNVNFVNDRYFTGLIDEVRVGPSAVSDYWATTEFNNQFDPESFITVSQEYDLLNKDLAENENGKIDNSDDIGYHNQFAEILSKDGRYDTIKESSVNTKALHSNSATGRMLVGGGNADWRVPRGTISMWVAFNSLSGGQKPWGQDGDFEVDLSGDDLDLDWGVDNAVPTSNNLFQTAKWYFIAVTWNEYNNTLRLYIGDENSSPYLQQENTTWADPVTATTMTENSFLASRNNNDPIDGIGDELRFYEIDRSLSDIIEDYNKTISGNEPYLKSYFPLDDSYTDLGPDGNDGVASGSPAFTTNHPTFSISNSRVDLEVGWSDIPTSSAANLAIYSGTTDSEDLLVDYWDGSQWNNIITDVTASSWNNVSITPFLIGSTFSIRFRDGTPTSDSSPDSWEIDVVILELLNYHLEWEHQAQSVDTNKEYYKVTVYGSSSDTGENFEVSIWDQSQSSWTTPLGNPISTTSQWYNYSVNPTLINPSTTWRYTGDNLVRDDVVSSLSVDYAGIASYNIVPEITSTPGNVQYFEGSTGNSLTWMATDLSPDTYIIYRNGTEVDTASWTNSTSMTINIDGLVRGAYNYTIVIKDQFNTKSVDTSIVTVIDNTDPVVDNPTDVTMVEQTTGNTINWTATDLHPDIYYIYQNGSQVETASWSSGVQVSYNLDGLLEGEYNFTIQFLDDSGNDITDMVIVTVNDETPPTLDQPTDITYAEGSSGNTIDWTATDLHGNTYTVYQNGSVYETGSWTSGVPISVNIDGLLKDSYNFTIIVTDDSGYTDSDTVFVTVEDQTPPSVSSPLDLQYEEGATGNTITWTLSDNYPTTFSIFKNGSLLYSSSWTNGDITINVDELEVGLHIYTIDVYDESDNLSSDTVEVSVTDSINPSIDSPSDINFSEGTNGNTVDWNPTDNNPDIYQILQNGSEVDTGTWISGGTISYPLDGLTPGQYNFTIIVFDTSDNFVSDEVTVQVNDTTNPALNSPSDIEYSEGTTGNEISWNPTDLHPDNYTIYKDSVIDTTGFWSSGVPITYSVDGLSKGSYNFTLVIEDNSGNLSSDTVIVTVVDTTDPVLSSPVDIQYTEGSTGNTISWTATDTYPNRYRIYQNGSQQELGTWSSGVPIVYDIDGLLLGTYNYTIIVTDDSGNSDLDTVIVTITDETPPSLSSPSDIEYSEGTTGHVITWTASDTHPTDLTLYRNGTIVLSSSWTSGDINKNVDGLGLGVHNYTLVLVDSSGNSATDTVLVTVNDTIFPSLTSPDDITYALSSTGNSIEWTASDLHAWNYTVYRNGSVEQTGTWISTVPIVVDIDGLSVGPYNFTIVVSDTTENQVSDTVIVNVISAPVFLDTPDDLYYIWQDTGNDLSWTVSDANPNQYIIYQDDVSVDSGMWTSEVPIMWNVDGLDFGVYNFTIWLDDGDGNAIVDQVNVTVSDMPLWDTPLPLDLQYDEGSSGNQILWNATDMLPDKYSVYQNGSFFDSGIWDNATNIVVDIDGLSLGVYNFTIIVNDTVNNQIIDTVIVTVVDITDPSVDSPSDVNYAEESTGNTISWTPTDIHPDTYFVYQNGSEVDSGIWSSGVPIVIDIDGLTKAPYNFTILLYDTSGNSITDEVTVIVTDETNPIVDSPLDVQYAEGASGNTITWTPTDTYPFRYTIFQDQVNTSYGSWSSGTPIVYDIDGLTKGSYNFTIQVFDESGNYVTDTVIVTVTDETLPIITDNPNDLQYSEGSIGNSLSWTATDTYNYRYTLYIDDTNSSYGTWSSGVAIVENIDGLLKGNHNITILILDESGNGVTDYVEVTVTDDTNPTLSSPSDFSYSEGATGNTIDWTPNDAYPFNYTIFRNGTSVKTGSWSDGVPISYNVDNLQRNIYNFTILIHDQSYNDAIDEVILTVIDDTLPTIDNPSDVTYAEGSSGNDIVWIATDLHPDIYVVYQNGTEVENGSWISGNAIVIDIDGLTHGQSPYNFTMVVFDDSGNFNKDEVIVIVTDETPPGVNSPVDFSYSEGTTGNEISWTPTDNYPWRYTIFEDDVNVTYGTWISGNPIVENVDGLLLGPHNFTILLLDTSGNTKTDTVIVTVIDDTNPGLDSPSDVTYSEGSSSNTITWTATDLHEDTYEVLLNGTPDGSGSWSDGVPIVYNIDGLAKGAYNFTIIVSDTSGNTASDEVSVIVTDNTDPSVSSPTDISYSEGTIGNEIEWTANDLHPATYDIQQNYVNISDDVAWADGLPITLDIDGLTKGTYNFTIIIYDQSGNYGVDTVIVTVTDDTLPTITSPIDFTYSEGTTGNEISWTSVENYPDNYYIYQNGTLNTTNSYFSGTPIVLNVDGLPIGVFNFTIVVEDVSGNSNNDTVIVTVVDDIAPSISSPLDIQYEEDQSNNEIIWHAIDNHNSTYEVFREVQLVQSGSWHNDTDIIVSIDGLLLGEYNYTIVVYDESGNSNSDEVTVTVVDVTDPSIVKAQDDLIYAELSSNNNLTWEVYDNHYDTYQILRGGKVVASGFWNNTANITVNVDGLVKGSYVFTLVVKDTSDNQVSDVVNVDVIDNILPILVDNTTVTSFEAGTTSHFLNWTATDRYAFNYTIYQNGSEFVSGIWQSNVDITLNIDLIELGYHNFTIVVSDESGNSVSDMVEITVVDTQAPVLDNTDPSTSIVNITEGTTGNSLSWTYLDGKPTTYMITRNETVVQSSGWTSGQPITINIDGLNIGNYNFTITVYDESSNSRTDYFSVNVYDKTAPEFVSNPSNTSYIEDTTGNNLAWSMRDKRGSGSYSIYQNGSLLEAGTWINNVQISRNIDGLSWARYNFTILLSDSSGNTNTSVVWVDVLDGTLPAFNEVPQSFEYIEGNSGYILLWNVTDKYPNTYTIQRNGITISTEEWSNDTPIILDIDGLSTGGYNYSILVTDQSNNQNQDWIYFDVIDVTPPTILSAPANYTYDEGTTGNTLIYEVEDRHPSAYIFYKDGDILLTKKWSNSTPIVVNIDGYDPGYYNFKIEIYDVSDNVVTHIARIRVKDPTVIDTNRPEIMINQTVYEGDIEIVTGNWTTSSGEPIANGNITAKLFLQEVVREFTTKTDVDGHYRIVFNYTSQLPGEYQWQVIFEKDGYQPWNDIQLDVVIVQHTYNLQINTLSQLTQGQPYFISAIVTYNNDNSTSALSLNGQLTGRKGGAVGVVVSFQITLFYEDGTQTSISKTATTNGVGVATIELTGQETTNLLEIGEITARVSGSNVNRPVSTGASTDTLPTILPPEPGPITRLVQFLDTTWYYFVGGLILIVVSAGAVFYYRRRQIERLRRLSDSIKVAHEELQAIDSIQSIIIQTSSKLTVYEELVQEGSVNANLVGGMVTAFSSFLNELGSSNVFGFEVMERENASLTVHRGEFSNFIVISSQKVPILMYPQIQQAQKEIESTFKSTLTQTDRGVKKLTKEQVHPLLDKASFKIQLAGRLTLNNSNINKVLGIRSISRALKQNVLYLRDLPASEFSSNGTFTIHDIYDFFSSNNITDRVTSRIIMISYHFEIIESVDPEDMFETIPPLDLEDEQERKSEPIELPEKIEESAIDQPIETKVEKDRATQPSEVEIEDQPKVSASQPQETIETTDPTPKLAKILEKRKKQKEGKKETKVEDLDDEELFAELDDEGVSETKPQLAEILERRKRQKEVKDDTKSREKEHLEVEDESTSDTTPTLAKILERRKRQKEQKGDTKVEDLDEEDLFSELEDLVLDGKTGKFADQDDEDLFSELENLVFEEKSGSKKSRKGKDLFAELGRLVRDDKVDSEEKSQPVDAYTDEKKRKLAEIAKRRRKLREEREKKSEES